ncbi:MAG: Zn-dependent alcohol dehydrogenase [Dehalococcoidales bacterium]|nr:Zn-dependent alcohol dehydrogenase [Dehalococcoidales bacterium]
MKAAVVNEHDKPLDIEDVVLADPKEGEVRVKIAATAICHSDVHDIKGELPGPTPFIPGHESAGYVDEVGPGVTAFKPGDPVMVSLLSSCGACYFCVTGLPHLCTEKFAPLPYARITKKDGSPIDQKGKVAGFAEYVLVSQSQLMKVPDGMPLTSACLMSCGVMTGFGAVINRAKVPPMKSVVVMGLGGVGINSIQGAAIAGAYPIIGVDVLDEKMENAKKFGATHGVNAKAEDAVKQIRELTDGRGADYVFVTVGAVSAISQGMDMTGVRGTTVVVGLPPIKDQLCFSPMGIIATEKSLIGGFMGSTNMKTDIPKMIDLYQAGILKLDELVTATYPLEKVNEAIESTASGKALRNVLVFD